MSFDSISCQLGFEFGTPSPQAVAVALGTHDLTPYALVFPMGSPQSRSFLRDLEPFLPSHMASSRDRPAATTAGNYYLPGRPPILP